MTRPVDMHTHLQDRPHTGVRHRSGARMAAFPEAAGTGGGEALRGFIAAHYALSKPADRPIEGFLNLSA